jgi:hypothetical protein
MANRPDHLPLEQHASLPTIDKIINQWCVENPRLPNTDIRAMQNHLPPLQDREARFQQTKYIQHYILQWKTAFLRQFNSHNTV